LAGPTQSGQGRWFDRGFIVINSILGLFLVLVGAEWLFFGPKVTSSKDHITMIKRDISHMKKKGLNYSDLYRILAALDSTNRMSNGGISIINIINDSPMASESKEYFKNALIFTEGGSFAQSKNADGKKIQFEKKYFNELLKYV
jgi:hypothetical protein